MKTADEILRKHEEENEIRFYSKERNAILEAMEEYRNQEDEPVIEPDEFFPNEYTSADIMQDIITYAERLTGGRISDGNRKMKTVKALHIVRALGYFFSGLSLKEITAYIGRGTHTMPLHSIKCIEGYMYSDKEITDALTQIFSRNYSKFLNAEKAYGAMRPIGRKIFDTTQERLSKYPVCVKLIKLYYLT